MNVPKSQWLTTGRPAIGGSTPVPIEQRIDVWLETVPVLLQRLNVKHVALLTHSAGTIYTLNTLARLPHILDPKCPYVAFLGTYTEQITKCILR